MSFQKIIILVMLSLTLFSFSNCGSTKGDDKSISFQENPPFSIENTTSQKTIAGIKDGGTTTKISVPVSQVKEGVQFKDLYYAGQMVEATTHPRIRAQYLGYFTEGKKDFMMDGDAKQEVANTNRIVIPFDLKENEAVFSYTFEGKLFYYKITTIKELPPIALPSQNPNNSGLIKG